MLKIQPPFEFHHVGFACKNIEQEQARFLAMGYQQEGSIFEDAHQGVRGCFLYAESALGGSPRIELLENLPESNTLTPWLDKSSPIYHLAYLVDDIEQAIAWARTQRGKVVSSPYPAVAFDLRPVCFVMFKGGFLLEFIQS